MSQTQALDDTTAPTKDDSGRAGPSTTRLDSLDWLRGLVIVLMVLDHTRDFVSHARFDPMDLSKTTVAFFFTRWVTHFCAPVFVFLAGVGIYLSRTRQKTSRQLAWFLLSRGLWLVLLELTVVRFGWFFTLDTKLFLGQVIWAIGSSMVLFSVLVFLPTWVVGLLGVAIVGGHNLLDGIDASQFGSLKGLWICLVSGSVNDGMLQPLPGVTFHVPYPVLPWLGVMAIGYALGGVWQLPRERRLAWLFCLGLLTTALFVGVRAVNGYGDAHRWSEQSSVLYSLFSFLDCTKYPPSLLFVLMTLGPALLVLALVDQPPRPFNRILVTFGRVPLFFYLLHLPVLHLIALAIAFVRHGDVTYMFGAITAAGSEELPPEYGFGLPCVYLVWLLALAILYPICAWFAEQKRQRRFWWLSYL